MLQQTPGSQALKSLEYIYRKNTLTQISMYKNCLTIKYPQIPCGRHVFNNNSFLFSFAINIPILEEAHNVTYNYSSENVRLVK